MSVSPRLSVVVPFYGVEDYLAECLESLRAQTMRDMQIILVDDGSPDNSIEIAQAFAAADSRFEIIRQENAGLGPARNTGYAAAQGQYVTFVDSDDIVPLRAYEMMLESLDRTGSSFAIGNAKRFSRTSGVRQSWAHARPCAKNVTATHILERPILSYDRMVWNKVYRKDFYDEHGYAFPAIRYEDWPVTMKAHLQALTVDILNAPMYYWRERESGDSITQQVFKYDNLLDRVVSAEKVFAILDELATPAVREAAHGHLAEIDLVAIAQAFAHAPEADHARMLELSDRFLAHLKINVGAQPRFNQLQYHALQAHDTQLLGELARFRDSGGLVGGTFAQRNRLKPWRWDLAYPGRGRRSVPKAPYELPFTKLGLRTAVTDVQWSGERLEFTATAQISHLHAAIDDALAVRLVNGIDRIDLDVEVFDTIDEHRGRSAVGLRFGVDLDLIRSLDEVVWPLRFEVERTCEGVRRRGFLTAAYAGSPQFPDGCFLEPDVYLQPGLTAGNVYAVHRVAFPTVVEDVTVEGNGIRIVGTLSEPTRSAALVVKRPAGDIEFDVDLSTGQAAGTQRFEVLVDAEAVLAGDGEDDPFLHSASRTVKLRTDFGDANLTWPHHRGAAIVRVSGGQADLDDDAATVDVGDRLVGLTRSRFGIVSLFHAPVKPTVRTVAQRGEDLIVSGPHQGVDLVGALVWRKYLPNSDDFVDIDVNVSIDGDEYTGRLPVTALLPHEDLPTLPGAPAADYTLFYRSEAGDTPLPLEAAGAMGLPIERWVMDRHVLATTVAGGARVQVR